MPHAKPINFKIPITLGFTFLEKNLCFDSITLNINEIIVRPAKVNDKYEGMKRRNKTPILVIKNKNNAFKIDSLVFFRKFFFRLIFNSKNHRRHKIKSYLSAARVLFEVRAKNQHLMLSNIKSIR